VSAEIPWTVGPGESLKPAPPIVTYTHAQYEAERLAFAEAYSGAMRVRLEAERDRALIECQRLRAVAGYWQAKAEGRP
jgi:hypothetical protein